MKYEIVYGEDPRAGVAPAVIGTVTAISSNIACRRAMMIIDDKLWPFLTIKRLTKPSVSATL